MRKADVIAGISVAGLMLPEAVAYAAIAGLPAQRAVLAAIAGALVYAFAGRSRFAIVSPTSSSAAILAAALAAMGGDAATKLLLATLAVGIVAATFLVAGFARLGGLTSFVSRPVLRGFAFGLAITIIVKQLPVLAGVETSASDLFHLLAQLFAALPRWHPASLVTGAAALAALLALRRVPSLPGAFLVLAGGILASILLDLPARGVATVGTIDLAPAWPRLQSLAPRQLMQLAELAVPLFLILLAESWGTMRALALRHGDTLDPDRELRALGWANLAAAAVQGMPVGAGFSAGSASEAAGARTRLTGAVAAIVLAALVLFGAGAIARLPQPVLAAVVIAALTHALGLAPFARLRRLGRDEGVAIGAAIGVLVLGVLNGMLFAILLSIGALVRRLSTPALVRLGRLDGGHDYVDVARHPDAVPPAGIGIWRPAEPLFFGNAERVLALVASRQAAEPALKTIVLSLEESFDLDSTALDALLEFDAQMKARGVTLRLARVRDAIRDLLAAADAHGLAARASFSVDDAVTAAEKENA